MRFTLPLNDTTSTLFHRNAALSGDEPFNFYAGHGKKIICREYFSADLRVFLYDDE